MRAAIDTINAMPEREGMNQLKLQRDTASASIDRATIYEFLNLFASAATKTPGLKGDVPRLVRVAARAMLRSVDPDNNYIEFRPGKGPLEGELGLSLLGRQGKIYINRVFPGSSGESAGLVPGDTILAINGESVQELVLGEARLLLNGPTGTTAQLLIQREDSAQSIMVDVTYQPPSELAKQATMVKSQLIGGIVVIVVPKLEEDTAARVREVLLTTNGSGEPPAGYILDLRGNEGGYLDQVTAVADLFVGDADVGKTKATGCFGDEDVTFHTSAGGEAEGKPLAVLIDGKTAAGGEMLAAELSEGGHATTIGQTTPGNWKIWTIVPVITHALMRVVSSRFISPAGVRSDGQGLTPKIETPVPDAEHDYALEKAMNLLVH